MNIFFSYYIISSNKIPWSTKINLKNVNKRNRINQLGVIQGERWIFHPIWPRCHILVLLFWTYFQAVSFWCWENLPSFCCVADGKNRTMESAGSTNQNSCRAVSSLIYLWTHWKKLSLKLHFNPSLITRAFNSPCLSQNKDS